MGTRPTAPELESAALPTATLHEASGRDGALPAAIKPVGPSMRLCGPAVTVSSPAGDNLSIHEALYMAEPGDVLVVKTGDKDYGYWGEIMTVAAQVRGLGGLVIDGGVRDRDRLIELGLPVFSNGICIRGTGKDPSAPASINLEIQIGDVAIAPGDVVVGDADGVVVIAQSRLAEVVTAARDREEKEQTWLESLRAGVRTLDLI